MSTSVDYHSFQTEKESLFSLLSENYSLLKTKYVCSFDFSKFTVGRNLTNILTVTNNSVSQDLCDETSKFSVGQDLCKDTTKFTVVRNRTNLLIVTKDLVRQNLCEDISKFTVVRNHTNVLIVTNAFHLSQI